MMLKIEICLNIFTFHIQPSVFLDSMTKTILEFHMNLSLSLGPVTVAQILRILDLAVQSENHQT
jgi:hypothetical protein